jgi:hypothetical protein
MHPSIHSRDPEDIKRQAQKFREQAEEYSNEENEKMEPIAKEEMHNIDDFKKKYPKIYAAIEERALAEDRAQRVAEDARFQAEMKKTADARVMAAKAASRATTATKPIATKADPASQWEADAALRAEFGDNKERWLAFAKAEAAGSIRLFSKK